MVIFIILWLLHGDVPHFFRRDSSPAKPQFLHLLIGHGHRPNDRAGPGLVVFALLILRKSGSRDFRGKKKHGEQPCKKKKHKQSG